MSPAMHPPSPNRRCASALLLCAAALCAAPAAQANSDPFVGELMLFAGTRSCPNNWTPARGQLLPISNYETLYSLLGTAYGGDGQTTFGLPDLRARMPVGWGQGPGLTPIDRGDQGGIESVTLTQNHLPPHNHQLLASTLPASHAAPAQGRIPAAAQNGGAYASAGGASVPIVATTVAGGGSEPIDVRSPTLAMTWCIAVYGIYPSRP